ncbi:flagellar biosynthesis sigma factor [Sulfuricella sp. T08]|uniref:RNA polymerase sigma factor FliA n=1 Tax=Sulfuricella sp. T08 TaxID=1632857 RepID=UPI0006179C96|nr:RNA polymerase sigma factor FliA [Sulfuricella sp. T08]GAO37519.1 flagellar biosynthesis sigma factor [Sulfuricella sp. T08]
MYAKTGLEKNQYVVQYAPLVKRIAYHLMARLPASVQVDDLIQVGMIGLLDAVSNYDDTQGAQFETYAVQRIRGAMLDELRQCDWLPRSARKTLRQIETAMNALEQRVCRAPTEREVADELHVSLDDYQQMLLDARGCQLLHYEDLHSSEDEDFFERHCADDSAGPLAKLQDGRFREKLIEAIGILPEREKLMMAMYYEEELNLREIGEVLGVSESRVCQLHSQAMARLRSKLKEWL